MTRRRWSLWMLLLVVLAAPCLPGCFTHEKDHEKVIVHDRD